MFKKTLGLFFSMLAMTTGVAAESYTDHITYNWLAEKGAENGITDHVAHWRRLFNTMHVRGFLECGIGFSTKYFLDHTEKVVTVEFVTPGYGPSKYQQCYSLFYDIPNWIPMLYNEELRSNSFNNACAYQSSMHKDYSLLDPAYLRELFQYFNTIIKKARTGNYPIDVAFVHSGVYIRGDFVKLLMAHKIPIIAAHNTSTDNGPGEESNLYGWNKINAPSNYIKIYIPFGQGTTFWISDQLPDVIASMQAYRDSIIDLKDFGYGVSFDDIKNIADDILF